MAKVIWQRPHRTLSLLAVEDGNLQLIQCLLGPRSLRLKQDVDPFSRFCTAMSRDRQTDRITDWQKLCKYLSVCGPGQPAATESCPLRSGVDQCSNASRRYREVVPSRCLRPKSSPRHWSISPPRRAVAHGSSDAPGFQALLSHTQQHRLTILPLIFFSLCKKTLILKTFISENSKKIS